MLVGGDNITLSRIHNTITIIGGVGGAAGSNTLGMSDAGNTSGTSGIISGSALQYVIAGGNNVTLSQSIDGVSGTVTISAFNQTIESQTFGISNLGNSVGTSGVASGGQIQFVIAGGNNITLSQSINGASGTITISAANFAETQTVPAIGTAVKGVASVGSTGTITRFAPEDHAHVGLAQFQISGNTLNSSNIVVGSLVLAGGNNITLSQVTGVGIATVTISAAAGGGAVVSNAIQPVASATGSGTNTSRFAADDHIHAGLGQFQISGNTSNSSNVVFGSLVLAGGNNITLSQVTAAGAATGCRR